MSEVWYSERLDSLFILNPAGRDLIELEYPMNKEGESFLTQKILIPKAARDFMTVDPDVCYIGKL